MVHPVQEVLESLYAAGRCPRLHINALSAGVVLPSFVRDQWKERLVIDLDPSYPLELEYGDDAVQANLSFAGSVTRCVFPWRAIYIVADRATGRGIKIEQNIPASLRAGSTTPGASGGDPAGHIGADASRDARAARTTTTSSAPARRSFREGLSVVPDLEHDSEGDEGGDSTDQSQRTAEQRDREPLRATVELPSKEEALGSGRARARAQRDKAVRDKEARAAAAALDPQGTADGPDARPQANADLGDSVREAGESGSKREPAHAEASDAAPGATPSSEEESGDTDSSAARGPNAAKAGEQDAADAGDAPRRSKSRKRSAKDPTAAGADHATEGAERAEESSSEDASQGSRTAARGVAGAESSAAALPDDAAAKAATTRSDSTKRPSPTESSAEADLRAKQRRAAFRVISGGNSGDNG